MKVNIEIQRNYSNTEILQGSNKTASIKGVVKKQNISIPCYVRLYEKLTGRLVDQILSDENGNYTFNNLYKTEFYLVANDPVRQFNAVIADMVVPK